MFTLFCYYAGMQIVESQKSYEKFNIEIDGHDIILFVVPLDICSHVAHNHKFSAAFIYDIQKKDEYIISFLHNDLDFKCDMENFVCRMNKRKGKIYSFDKKDLIQMLPLKNVYDINLISYLKNNSIIDNTSYETAAHSFLKRMYSKRDDLGNVVPIEKHKEMFDNLVQKYLSVLKNDEKLTDDYHKINDDVIETLAELESNGICINRECFQKHFNAKTYRHTNLPIDIVYSQYNIYTSTGRPSNRFDGVNYAALNKDDGCRKCFISRWDKSGKLILIDYSAFHPRIISYLTKFELPLETDIYQYLGELYFNKTKLSPVDMEDAKKLTFRQLYGGVEKQYEHIKYFRRLKNFIDHQWDTFQKEGYVETPIFHRKITQHHILDPNPNKLFNYILQATETEIAIPTIKKLNDFLRDKRTKAILYTYDSVLLDFCKQDTKRALLEIINIMKNKDKFPVKIYIGDNYDEMKQISIF